MNYKNKTNKKRRRCNKVGYGKLELYNSGCISRIIHSYSSVQKNRRNGKIHIKDSC